MKIIRRLNDGLVQYVIEGAYELTNTHYSTDELIATDIKLETHEALDNVTLPVGFFPGVYYYNDGVWFTNEVSETA